MREEQWIWKQRPRPDFPSGFPVRPPVDEGGERYASPASPTDRSGPNEEVFDLFVEFFSKKQPLGLKDLIDELEKRIIVTVLVRVRGNQKEAARALGLKYTTLNEKVKKYGLLLRRGPAPSSL